MENINTTDSSFSAASAVIGNAEFICKIYNENIEILHGSDIALEEWRDVLSLNDEDEHNFIIYKGETPAGWLKINGLNNKDTAWISMLVISNEMKHQGAGSFAVQFSEDYVAEKGFNKLGIHTTEDNLTAQCLYKKCGYAITDYNDCIGDDGLPRKEYTFVKSVACEKPFIKLITSNEAEWNTTAQYAKSCSWSAGKNLAAKMEGGHFLKHERVCIAVLNGEIAGYCTFLNEDCIPDVPYSPYIGFVFVDEKYRGMRLSEKMICTVINYARELGHNKVYLVSDHVNLYEKYGFIKVDEKPAPWNCEITETIFVRPTDLLDTD